MDSGLRNEESATDGRRCGPTSAEHAKVRGISERTSTELVARIRQLLSELNDHDYIGENGERRILGFIANNVRKLDEVMSNGGGMPEQWIAKADLDLDC